MGASHQNIIELNGKLYDAKTGQLMNKDKSPAPKESSSKSTAKGVGKVLDGFVSRKHTSPTTAQIRKPSGRSLFRKSQSSPAPVKHHKTQKASTLMRKSVKKPAPGKSMSQPEIHGVTTNVSRFERALSVPKSKLVSRFNRSLEPKVSVKMSPLAVASAPKEHKQAQHQSVNTAKHSRQAVEQAQPTSANSRLFKRAMDKSTSHEEVRKAHPRKHRLARALGVKPKHVRYGSSLVAVLLLVGFFAYQNVPNFSMRIAATKAGFNASIPSYKPAGFALAGPIEYGPGYITIGFQSNSDERNFHVTQRVSQWSSESLLENFLVANNKTYQTYQDKGRTIYIYDNSNATWVNGGVWYQVDGNSSLSSDQLIRIANSI